MAQLFCIVALLVTVVGITQAAPAPSLSEKEDFFRELLQRKGVWDDWFGSDEKTTDTPTTTQAVTTTGESEPVPFNVEFSKGTGTSHLTSGQICGMAQSLFPRSENVETKRDLVVNMIYHLCLPSVGPEDLDAIALMLGLLRGEERDAVEPSAPTTPKPEEKPSVWQSLLDKLAAAQDNAEETGDGEGVAEEAATPAAPAENETESPVVGNGDNSPSAADGAGADAGDTANAGDDAGAGAAVGADAGATGATGATGAGADGEGGPETATAPAKRMEGAEFLKLLLKAVERNEGEKSRKTWWS